ncbi:MAG TPA: DDE-type integrase/transposase/recombinase [Polyangiaceae bacterium]|nr:DDE-type integrase/transposase/recombinase [Polyangiaceae bacterium]
MDAFQPKDQAESIALFRSQIIGPLTVRELSRGELTEELAALSRKLFRTPRGHSARTYSVPTLERWLHKYKTEGLEGLKPKPRKDRGRGRHLTEEQKALLVDVRREHPSTSVPVILETLQDDGMLESDAVSATTVRRMFRERGLDRIAARNATGRNKVRLRWQADRPGALWHADVCHGGALKLGEGQPANVRIHAILDDASRYIIAIEAMHQEREVDMLKLLVRAVRRHGPPDALYLDNGSTYRGQALALATARMGCVLIHARPYDAPARGKMERVWRTLREQCLQFTGSLTTLHDLNVRLWAWVDERYHKAAHGGLLGKTPESVYTSCPRCADDFDESKLRAALTIHARRRVRRDSTVAMDGQDWETDLGFLAGKLVTVGRCLIDPDDPPWIEHEGRQHPLHPVDPAANAHRPRSVCCLDQPHDARVPFDPPRTTLDRALGRSHGTDDSADDDFEVEP